MIFCRSRVTNTLSINTIFILVLLLITEQQAFQSSIVTIIFYQVWAKAVNMGQKPLCLYYHIPKTIVHLFTLTIRQLKRNLFVSTQRITYYKQTLRYSLRYDDYNLDCFRIPCLRFPFSLSDTKWINFIWDVILFLIKVCCQFI